MGQQYLTAGEMLKDQTQPKYMSLIPHSQLWTVNQRLLSEPNFKDGGRGGFFSL